MAMNAFCPYEFRAEGIRVLMMPFLCKWGIALGVVRILYKRGNQDSVKTRFSAILRKCMMPVIYGLQL